MKRAIQTILFLCCVAVAPFIYANESDTFHGGHGGGGHGGGGHGGGHCGGHGGGFHGGGSSINFYPRGEQSDWHYYYNENFLLLEDGKKMRLFCFKFGYHEDSGVIILRKRDTLKGLIMPGVMPVKNGNGVWLRTSDTSEGRFIKYSKMYGYYYNHCPQIRTGDARDKCNYRLATDEQSGIVILNSGDTLRGWVTLRVKHHAEKGLWFRTGWCDEGQFIRYRKIQKVRVFAGDTVAFNHSYTDFARLNKKRILYRVVYNVAYTLYDKPHYMFEFKAVLDWENIYIVEDGKAKPLTFWMNAKEQLVFFINEYYQLNMKSNDFKDAQSALKFIIEKG